jgi:hypothetical protein
MRSHRYAVETTVSFDGAPQAAVVGIAVAASLEIVFDTLSSTRKARNISANPRVAFVIGGWVPGDERTVQYAGVADTPGGQELERLKGLYYETFPDGPDRVGWPGLVYVRARPTWLRYSDFNVDPPRVIELGEDQLSAWLAAD